MADRAPTTRGGNPPVSRFAASASERQVASTARKSNDRADLAAFAKGLAARLPGSWTVVAQEHAAYADQFTLAQRVWDLGHVHWAFDQFVLSRDAVLTSDTGCELVVVDRPRRKREFLIAALQPSGSDGAGRVNAPNGIVVDADPVRAATAVANRLLPRYERAVHEAGIEQVATAVAAGKRVLAEWDAISDSLCDADHWPLDERYDLRQQQRDAEMWALFAPFLDHGPALVAHAEEMHTFLDPQDRADGRWPYRLRVLREALEGGARVSGRLRGCHRCAVAGSPSRRGRVREGHRRARCQGLALLPHLDGDRRRARRDGGGRASPARPSGQVTAVRAGPAARARSAHAIRSSVATTAAVSAAAAPPSLLAHDRVRRSR